MLVHRIAMVAALAALGSCKASCNVETGGETVHAKVECEVVSGPAAECTVRQDQGTKDIEVCWDFKVTCDSGATLTAPHTCVHVADGKTTKTTIPSNKLTVAGDCTGEKHASLGTMTINGQPSKP